MYIFFKQNRKKWVSGKREVKRKVEFKTNLVQELPQEDKWLCVWTLSQ